MATTHPPAGRRALVGPFVWERRFVLGLPDVDDQHRHLLDLLNTAATAQPVDLPARLEDLLDAVALHFAHEQHLLDTSGCPDRATHRAEHRRFLDELGRLPGRLCVDHDDPWMVVTDLGHAIIEHMSTMDAAMAAWLRRRS